MFDEAIDRIRFIELRPKRKWNKLTFEFSNNQIKIAMNKTKSIKMKANHSLINN
jgi:hypothetical protein